MAGIEETQLTLCRPHQTPERWWE